jgi:pyrimidine deaminase RibD-like protein
MHADYMRLALTLAEKATRDGEPPFGALLVGPDGKVVAEAPIGHPGSAARDANSRQRGERTFR